MAREWRVYSKKADFDAIAEKFGIDRLTAGLLVNRGVRDDKDIDKYLNGGLKDLYDPMLLPDMERAVDRVKDSIITGKHIRIVGDYDIDGVCSVYILIRGLTFFAERIFGDSLKKESEEKKCELPVPVIDHVIPDRIRDGYGINRHIIERAVEEKVDVIITCDNGISAIDELEYARDNGISVIVTDHHEVRKDEEGRDILPPCDAVTDPKRSDSIYPLSGICGAVVAWKLVWALLRELTEESREAAFKVCFEELLPFAAVATVGDVMELLDENRIIVREGLKLINSGRLLNLGMRKLIEGCGIADKEIGSYHIGFVIGPCINAGGRLETAETALRLFMSTDEKSACALSEKLIELNARRKEMTEEGVKKACELCEKDYADDKVLVVYLGDLHESLAGIVAGRIRERYSKPAFVITDAEEGLKGSGRSIEAYHMFDKLCEVADILEKFGGHPMAAGLSLKRENLDELRKRLNEGCGLTEDDLKEKKGIDFIIPVSYITSGLIEEMDILKPFGQGNEKPVLADRELSATDIRILGKNKNVLKLRLIDKNGYNISGIMFGDGEENAEKIKDIMSKKGSVSIVYYPEINVFNGRRSLQLTLLDIL